MSPTRTSGRDRLAAHEFVLDVHRRIDLCDEERNAGTVRVVSTTCRAIDGAEAFPLLPV